jgi:hypothetical protein
MFLQSAERFYFSEMVVLRPNGLGFNKAQQGKSVRFRNKEKKVIIDMRKPHTKSALVEETALKEIYGSLANNELI